MIFVVALAALTLFACGRRRGTSRATFGARQVRELQQRAAHELGCTERGLTVTPLSDRVMQVHGCGQLRDYAYGTGRGSGWHPMQPVYVRAAAEMVCPVAQLSVQAPTAMIRNAAGCGRTARYDLVCGSLECAWTMTAHGGAWAGSVEAAPVAAPREVVAEASAPVGVPGASASAAVAPADDAVTVTVPTPADVVPAPVAAPATVTTSGDEIAIPAPPAPGSPEELLRAVLDAQRPRIHGCLGPGVIPVRASWSAEGTVTIALDPPLAGTAAEGCLRVVIGAQRVPAISPGEIIHHVR